MSQHRQRAVLDPFSRVARTDIGLRFPLLSQEGRCIPSDHASPRVVHQAFDFESIADATFLGSFSADPRHPNLLVQCATADIPLLIPRMARLSRGMVRTCMVGSRIVLPDEEPSTLILHDVARLSVPQQVEVMDWIAARTARTQVVSIASVPLRSLVEEGLFLQGLFHRLCVVEASANRRLWAVDRRSRGERVG